MPSEKRVRGTARIDFRNTSDVPLTSLVLHLYMNAFRDRDSVFMRDSRGQLRGESAKGAGYITLKTLKLDGRDALAKAARELVPGDTTQLSVPLEPPLAPGETVRIETVFDTHLPRIFARAGYADDFFAVAQWFPKPAALNADGTFESFPYEALGEFYADFADYSLRVKTPRDYRVGATGKLVEERVVGSEIVRRYEAARVHDAAFVASPSLLEKRERVGRVDVTYLVADGYDLPLDRLRATVAAGLSHFGARFGPYPYPTLTVVLPPRAARGAAGMEYPTLFLSDGSWLGPPSWLHAGSHAFVTAHELAHQWFQGMLASNEVRWAVLDEGLAEWATIDLLRTLHGDAASLSAYGPISRFELERLATFANAPPSVPASWPVNAYTHQEYGRAMYTHAAIALETIRRAYGKERFDRALGRYARRQRFRHPTPRELGEAFDDAYGAGFAARVLFPLVIEQQSAAVHLAEARCEKTSAGYVSYARVRRSGAVSLPTWVAFYDVDGNELTRKRFPAALDKLTLRVETSARVARIALDPDRALLVDTDVRDQIATLREPPHVGLATLLIAGLQALLSLVGP